MSIREELRKKLTQAMKDKDEQAKNLLRLVLGELSTADARQPAANEQADDQRVIGIVKKLMEANSETVNQIGEHGVDQPSQVQKVAELSAENGYLLTLIPPTLTVGQVRGVLGTVAEQIKSAKSEGMATGIAMKAMKASGASNVDSAQVIEVVKEIRG